MHSRVLVHTAADFITQAMRMGNAVSFLLTQRGVEIPVSRLAQPVRLTVPVSDAGALMRGYLSPQA